MELPSVIWIIFIWSNMICKSHAVSCSSVCSWLPWEDWSACSSTCGGGSQSRNRPLCCNTGHTFTQCISSCGLNSTDSYEFQQCGTSCFNGGNFVGYCICSAGYYGYCCQNRVTCGNPGGIANGVVIGNSYNYGDLITYQCNQHYNLTDGDEMRVCQGASYGYWTGEMPYCAFVNTCASNPCLNNATCVDGLDMYTCDCTYGYSGIHCEYDMLPPFVQNCSKDQNYTISHDTIDAQWEVPVFSEYRGEDLYMTKNYPKPAFTFPWGKYVIQYTATKQSNAMRAECNFTIDVRPFPCEPLPAPIHGAMVCNGWETHLVQVCEMFCEQNWSLPAGYNIKQQIVCGATGNWAPAWATTVSGCTETLAMFDTANEHHYYSGLCSDQKVALADSYLQHLNQSDFYPLCLENEHCNSSNVQVTCNETTLL